MAGSAVVKIPFLVCRCYGVPTVPIMQCRLMLNTMPSCENRTDPNITHTDLFGAPHKCTLIIKISHVQCLSEIPTGNGPWSSFTTPDALAPFYWVVLLCFSTMGPGTPQVPRMVVGDGRVVKVAAVAIDHSRGAASCLVDGRKQWWLNMTGNECIVTAITICCSFFFL